jgi:multiple sugar transport system substrate-binding protein
MKKSWIALFIVFVAIVAVAAQVAAQAATPELSGNIRVGSWESGDALTYWNNAITGYEAAHPNVKVTLEAIPQDYGTKLLAEFAAGTAPDVFMVGDGDAAHFQALGVTQDLAPYISGANGFDPNILYPNVEAFGQVAGSTYYLTKDYSPLVLYYNADAFKAAGVDTPTNKWTQADLLSAAQKLTVDTNGKNATDPAFDATNIKQWGIQLPDGWGATDWTRGILPIIYQNGGKLVADDGTKTDGFMNSDATVNALQWYVDLIKKNHVAPSKTDAAAFSGVDLFQTGQVAMLWTGVWPLGGYKTGDSAIKFNFGTQILPAGSAGNANVLCWSGFALYSQSQNKDVAWDFLKYMATGDGAKQLASYALTDVKSIVAEQGLDKDQYEASVIADLANVQKIPEQSTPFWAQCGDKYFVQELDTVLEGDVAVKDAMTKASSEADACLASAAAAATPIASS